MQSISYAWTTPALLAGRKTVTRRNWDFRYAKRFHKGDLVAAYNRQARFGGKRVATVRLTHEPYEERVGAAPESDYEAEGLAYMKEQGISMQGVPADMYWRAWKIDNPLVWVVRFELVEVL